LTTENDTLTRGKQFIILVRLLSAAALCNALLLAQTTINLGTQGRNVDFTNAPYTRPVKTGTSLPASCSPGELFFNLSAAAGQNLTGCAAVNSWIVLGNSSGGITQLTGDVTTLAASSGSVVSTLATVNGNPGTFGSATAVPVITVNEKGQITAVTTATVSGTGGSSTSTAIPVGPLASLSPTCSPGALYFATDQPAGQQLYTCSAANTWTQMVSLGPSGALAYTNGSLDIVVSVVPRLTAANTFSALNAFGNGVQLTTTRIGQPACASSTRGLFWFQNNGASKDSVQICVYSGTGFGWTSLY